MHSALVYASLANKSLVNAPFALELEVSPWVFVQSCSMKAHHRRAAAAMAVCCCACGRTSAYLGGVAPAARRGRSAILAKAAPTGSAGAAVTTEEVPATWDVTLVLHDDEITVSIRPDDTILQVTC